MMRTRKMERERGRGEVRDEKKNIARAGGYSASSPLSANTMGPGAM